MMKRLLFLMAFSIALCLIGQGQTGVSERYRSESITVKPVDDQQWDKLGQGIDYSKELPPEPPKPKQDEVNPQPDKADLGPIFKALGYILLAVGLAFILYLLVRKSEPTNRRIKAKGRSETINLENIEENLERADVDYFIEKAEADGNYQLAIRLHFLATLKALTLAGHLQWKKDKTNSVYLREMRNHPQRANFRRLTRTFERVWYGKLLPTSSQYQHWATIFNQFRQQLPAVESIEN